MALTYTKLQNSDVSTPEHVAPHLRDAPPADGAPVMLGEDAERAARADAVVARARSARDEAYAALNATEAEFVEAKPGSDAGRVRAARREFDDAVRDLELAEDHRSKVAADLADSAKRRTKLEILRLESALTPATSEELEERAVEHALRGVQFKRAIEDLATRRRDELVEINNLRARVGAELRPAPDINALMGETLTQLTELGLAAQARLGVRAVLAGGAFGALPLWRPAAGAREYITGREDYVESSNRLPDGTPMTVHGRLTTHIVERAAELVERVGARLDAEQPGRASRLATAAKTAAVVGAGVLAALTLTNG